jgi:hypothetical protein
MLTRSGFSSTDQGEGSGCRKGEAINDLLQRLGIDDDEIDDLIFESEETVPKKGISGWLWLGFTQQINSVR